MSANQRPRIFQGFDSPVVHGTHAPTGSLFFQTSQSTSSRDHVFLKSGHAPTAWIQYPTWPSNVVAFFHLVAADAIRNHFSECWKVREAFNQRFGCKAERIACSQVRPVCTLWQEDGVAKTVHYTSTSSDSGSDSEDRTIILRFSRLAADRSYFWGIEAPWRQGRPWGPPYLSSGSHALRMLTRPNVCHDVEHAAKHMRWADYFDFLVGEEEAHCDLYRAHLRKPSHLM